nr:P12 family lipoprotein [Borrelia puertoricensis]
MEDALKLKSEHELLESSFYETCSEIQNKIGIYPRDNGTKRQKLIQLRNQLNEQKSQIDMFRIQVDSGLDERRSAEFFVNKSQETLKEAITERLRNKKRRIYSSRRGNRDLLALKSRSEAENVLRLLESSSGKIGEAMGRKR